MLGLPIVESIKTTQLLAFVLCSLAMFGFARRHLGDAGGLVAAAAYGFAPYHLVNAYARGDSLGELTAMGILPLVLWALEVALAGSPRGAVALALSFAALILAHNLSALLAAPLISLWALVGFLRSRSVRGLTLAAGGGLLAVALTCFYWLPALWDRGYVHLEHVTTGYFDFRNHFLGLDRLVQLSPVYDYGLNGTADGALPFHLGLVQVVAALGCLVALRCRRGWLFLAVALGYVALATPLSRPLWERVPNLQIVQFPWRALAGASFGLALLAGLPTLALRGRARTAWAVAATAAVTVAGSLGASPERWRIPAEDVTVANVQAYETFTSAIGSTVRYEYLPREAKERPWTSWQMVSGEPLPRVRFPAGAASVRREGAGFVVETSSTTGGPLVLEHHFFPGWSASLPLSASDPEGFLRVDVPAGQHAVRLEWGETRLRQAAGFVSLSALVLLLAAVVVAARTRGAPAFAVEPAAAPTRLIAVVALLLFAPRFPWADLLQPTPASGPALDRRFAHEHAPWPYVEPAGHALGGARLLGYRQPAATAAGTPHAVELLREGDGDLTVRVVSPAGAILDAPRAVAEVRAAPAGSTSLGLDLPAATPPGLYRVEVALGGERRWLAPFRVLPPVQAPAVGDAPLARFGDRLLLEAIEAVDPRADRPGFRLRWRAAGPIDHDWRVSLRLVDEQGSLWGSQDGRPADGFYPTYLWPAGAVVDERRDVPTLAGTPPGPYRLEVRVYSLSGRTLDVLDARGAAVAPLYRSAPLALAPAPTPPLPKLGGPPLALVESSVGARAADAGARIPVSLLFRAEQAPGRRLDLVLRLGSIESRVPFTFPSTEWRAGEVVRVQHPLLIAPELPAGRHGFSARLVEASGAVALGPIELGEIEVRNRPRRFDAPSPRVSVGAVFGDALELVGFDAETRLRPGEKLPLTLWWRARGRTETSYTVFVHLLDAERRVRGQVDRVPGGGALPTSGWALGEVVEDRYEVPLEPSAPPGPYVLEVGLYDARNGERLKLASGADHLDVVKVGVE